MSDLHLHDPSLVLLVGPSAAGKSTFAATRFQPHEVVSLDACREMVSGDPEDQSATGAAVAVAREIVRGRLKRRLLTVVDSTALRPEDRETWLSIARETHSFAYAIVFDPGQAVCHERAKARGRPYSPKVIQDQHARLSREIRPMGKEGFRSVTRLSSPEAIDGSRVVRRKLFNDLRHEAGPFDVIGDVHGCTDELEALLARLGWNLSWHGEGAGREARLSHPEGRKLLFLGDACDRGPRPVDALLIMEGAVKSGVGWAVASNHDERLQRWIAGRDVQVTHGLDVTVADFEGRPEALKARLGAFIDSLPGHFVLDGGRLAIAHAALREDMVLGASRDVRKYCVHGPSVVGSDGERERVDWAADYRGPTAVVYGHVASFDDPSWFNNTICIDTACVFGGALTALRWPEKETVSVAAARAYAISSKPLFTRKDMRDPFLLDVADFVGKRRIETGTLKHVTVDAAQSAAAIEILNTQGVDPRWLVYLPPTMSPVEASSREGVLEHPEDAFAFYRRHGLAHAVMETKHMGSRMVALVCRDETVARRRFGVDDGHPAEFWTRLGRPFFQPVRRASIAAELSRACGEAGLFDALGSDWVLLDCEAMPWSAKAGGLIRNLYAPTGTAAVAGNSMSLEAMERHAARGAEGLEKDIARMKVALEGALSFDRTWRLYCDPDSSALKVAPFHLLASESATHEDKSHEWHASWGRRLAAATDMAVPTPVHLVALDEPESVSAAIDAWERETAAGAEGAVVKPATFLHRHQGVPIQPALKVRGKDYLRLVYGPGYDARENLPRLIRRGLGHKRSLAMRQFALGLEGIRRLIAGEPLRRVHECVLGVLALSSEPVDPRL